MFAKFTRKTWVMCVPVNFAKFWRTPFLQNTSGRLLLNTDNIWKKKKMIENEHIFQAWGIFKYFQNTCAKESEHSLKLSFLSSQYSDFLCFCNKWKIIDRYQLLWFVKNKCETIILLIQPIPCILLLSLPPGNIRKHEMC